MPVNFRELGGKRVTEYTITENDLLVLRTIAEGSKVSTERNGNWIIVDNPDYRDDNGEDPNLVISIARIMGQPEDYD